MKIFAIITTLLIAMTAVIELNNHIELDQLFRQTKDIFVFFAKDAGTFTAGVLAFCGGRYVWLSTKEEIRERQSLEIEISKKINAIYFDDLASINSELERLRELISHKDTTYRQLFLLTQPTAPEDWIHVKHLSSSDFLAFRKIKKILASVNKNISSTLSEKSETLSQSTRDYLLKNIEACEPILRKSMLALQDVLKKQGTIAEKFITE